MMRSSSSTLDYNSPNRDSSSKLSSSPNGERPRNQTLDHNILSFQPNKPARRDNRNNNNNNNISPEPNPNPNYPDPIPTTTPITPVNAVNAVLSSSSSSLVRYRECLKNHAASSGGLVLDGCGEFMPSGDEGTVEAMKCAACECHRNFHLKEIDGESQYNVPIVNIASASGKSPPSDRAAGDDGLRRGRVVERGSQHVRPRPRSHGAVEGGYGYLDGYGSAGGIGGGAGIEEAVSDKVQSGAEGEDDRVRGEARVEDSEARRSGGSAVLLGSRCQTTGFQGLDAQQ